jgi:hypothetical protein
VEFLQEVYMMIRANLINFFTFSCLSTAFIHSPLLAMEGEEVSGRAHRRAHLRPLEAVIREEIPQALRGVGPEVNPEIPRIDGASPINTLPVELMARIFDEASDKNTKEFIRAYGQLNKKIREAVKQALINHEVSIKISQLNEDTVEIIKKIGKSCIQKARDEEPANDATMALVGQLTYARGLDLSRGKITDTSLGHIKSLINLQYLNLNNTQLTDAGLIHIKPLVNLEYFHLVNEQITDASLGQLKGFTHLKILTLPNTISDESIAELKTTLPNVDIRTLALHDEEYRIFSQKIRSNGWKIKALYTSMMGFWVLYAVYDISAFLNAFLYPLPPPHCPKSMSWSFIDRPDTVHMLRGGGYGCDSIPFEVSTEQRLSYTDLPRELRDTNITGTCLSFPCVVPKSLFFELTREEYSPAELRLHAEPSHSLCHYILPGDDRASETCNLTIYQPIINTFTGMLAAYLWPK